MTLWRSTALSVMILEQTRYYRKTPKNSDTPKNCCNHPKTQTKWLYRRVMCSKSADGMANSADPDQTLIWVYIIYSVQKFRNNTVIIIQLVVLVHLHEKYNIWKCDKKNKTKKRYIYTVDSHRHIRHIRIIVNYRTSMIKLHQKICMVLKKKDVALKFWVWSITWCLNYRRSQVTIIDETVSCDNR